MNAERIRSLGLAALFLALVLGPYPAAAFPGHTSYDIVLGQGKKGSRRINNADLTSLNYPTDATLDRVHSPNALYVADSGNARVLAWKDVAKFRAGAAPDLILGQPDGSSVDRFRRDALSISGPNGVTVDKDGTLWVSDGSSGRVLGFKWPFDPAQSPAANATADVVLGQPDFATGFLSKGCNGGFLYSGVAGNASASVMCSPTAVGTDPEGNLFVADTDNHRVLVFKAPFVNGMAASVVLGQASMDGVQRQACNRGGVVGPTTLCKPVNLFVHQDGGTLRLYVTDLLNNRVVVFDDPLKDQTADRVFGQLNLTTATRGTGPNSLDGPQGVTVDTGGLVWISDGAHRVLGFLPPWNATGGYGARYVIGQLDAGSNQPNQGAPGRGTNPPSAATLFSPRRVTFDSDGGMVVPDSANHRLVYFPSPKTSGASASVVYGQSDFRHGNEGHTKAAGMAYPTSVAVDRPDPTNRPNEPMHVYVADFYNSRVLGWWDLGAMQDGKPADVVIGQRTFEDYACNMGRGVNDRTLCYPRAVTVDKNGDLWVADSWNHRVLRFARPFAGPRAPAANLVLGQGGYLTSQYNRSGAKTPTAGTLWHPNAVVVDDAGTVWVADRDNDRVVGYLPPYKNGMDARRLLIGNGVAGGYTVVGCPTGPNGTSLCMPTGLALDQNGDLWVAERNNNRVALYKTTPPDPNTGILSGTALAILGQASQANVGANSAGLTAQSLRNPEAVSVELTRQMDGSLTASAIVVGDTGNNRVLAYAPLTAGFQPAATTVVGQSTMATVLLNQDSVYNETPATVSIGMWGPNSVLALPEVLLISDGGATATYTSRLGQVQPSSGGVGNNRVILVKGPSFPAPSSAPWTAPDGGAEEQVPDLGPIEEPMDLRVPEVPDLLPRVEPDLSVPPTPPPPPPDSGCAVGLGGGDLPVGALALMSLVLLMRRRRRS